MPRKLKTYQTSQGFYDLAIAAPSMKAALEAWGASSNLFHQGFAKESEDSKVIAAAMAKPGIVLRRPVGSDTAFSEHSGLPSAASLDAPRRPGKAKPEKAKPAKEQKVDEKAERRAAAAYEKEQQRRERQRQKEEAAAAKARAERKAAMEKAETALNDAKREHNEAAAAIEQELAAVQRRADAEQERWEQLKESLETALSKAGR
jgi:colicin import membrane protein